MATFKAKARAIELLGKGQIADLPTAITELWKNGYDAYAKNLTCKLFLESYKDCKAPIFLLSDDGFGMSENDILDKWFVLGTDSKARGTKLEPSFDLERRVPMGEKGIGRLSVAYLGSQMLMLTKKKNEQANVLLLDWRILENYDFFLEDLNIPLFRFSSSKEFKSEFKKAFDSFKTNLFEDSWQEQLDYFKIISKQWDELNIPNFVYEEVINEFAKNDFHGTTFLVFTPHEQLLELSDKDVFGNRDDSAINYLRASLSGLYNDLRNTGRDFETHFFLYSDSGRYDLIKEFFTQDEMRHSDHWCKGTFDENGFFEGEIKIFNTRLKHTFKPNRPPGKTPYGPFSIEWGSNEKELKNTTLNSDLYNTINKKLDVLGGLYIYRDSFRVLPYGRPEYDFLEFEERRSRGAGYYFFSHRRFIGYIDITREGNSGLRDKAGREGFIQNSAYRQFKSDLIEFFIDFSTRYLRKTGENEDDTLRQHQLIEINEKYEKQLDALKKKNSSSKKAFLALLKEYFPKVIELKDEIDILNADLNREAEQLQINYNNYNRLISSLDDRKAEMRQLKLLKPKSMTLISSREKDYEEYRKEYAVLEDKVKSCSQIIEDTRSRINIENLKVEFNERFRNHVKSLDKQFSSFRDSTDEAFQRLNKLLKEEKDNQISLFSESVEPFKLEDRDSKDDISSKIRKLELLIDQHNQDIDHSISGFINHISNLQIDVDDDFLRDWYQSQNQNLEKRLNDYEELAQLGIAVEIIDHQFNEMYAKMKDSIHELDVMARQDDNANYSFRQLKGAFQHLETNYKLLQPLYRSSRRSREIITGREIEKYLKDFFESEFKRYRIEFSVNNDFRDYEFFTFDSIVKPTFINIINNAIYWLIPVNDRKISIELIDNEIRICNSGEKIEDTQLDDIFTLFYTRKKDGRGIGLYLAKKNLNTIGYELFATNDKAYNLLKGACFVIRKQ